MSLTHQQLDGIRKTSAGMVERAATLACDLCSIPAPTGNEEKRARFVAQQFQQRGYDAEIDDLFNVYARRSGATSRHLMLLAHTDTVFPATTPLTFARVGERMTGPGIGDNCLGVAAMFAAIDVLDSLEIDSSNTLRLVANVGEEGLGNLRGAWRAVERFRDETSAVLAIEGHNLGRITHVGVGSKRWRVTVSGPGGHSWGAFGEPSAIHGLGRIISAIAAIDVPEEPRTSFNVGMIEGGTSINTIAPLATALIDMRSVSAAALDELSVIVGKVIESEVGDGLETSVEVLGERPAGSLDTNHPLVQAAVSTLDWLGLSTVFDASSTDANVPISLGIPAICIGVTRGGRVHTAEEFVEVPPIEMGIAQLARLCADTSYLTTSAAG